MHYGEVGCMITLDDIHDVLYIVIDSLQYNA